MFAHLNQQRIQRAWLFCLRAAKSGASELGLETAAALACLFLCWPARRERTDKDSESSFPLAQSLLRPRPPLPLSLHGGALVAESRERKRDRNVDDATSGLRGRYAHGTEGQKKGNGLVFYLDAFTSSLGFRRASWWLRWHGAQTGDRLVKAGAARGTRRSVAGEGSVMTVVGTRFGNKDVVSAATVMVQPPASSRVPRRRGPAIGYGRRFPRLHPPPLQPVCAHPMGAASLDRHGAVTYGRNSPRRTAGANKQQKKPLDTRTRGFVTAAQLCHAPHRHTRTPLPRDLHASRRLHLFPGAPLPTHSNGPKPHRVSLRSYACPREPYPPPEPESRLLYTVQVERGPRPKPKSGCRCQSNLALRQRSVDVVSEASASAISWRRAGSGCTRLPGRLWWSRRVSMRHRRVKRDRPRVTGGTHQNESCRHPCRESRC